MAHGVIRGYRAVVDPIAVGRDHVTFVKVIVNDARQATLAAFDAVHRDIPEIEDGHWIAGGFGDLRKGPTTAIAEHRRILGRRINAMPHVSKTSTHVSMEAVADAGIARP